MTGRGTVGFSGEVRSEVAVPEVSHRRAGLKVSPSSGTIRFATRIAALPGPDQGNRPVGRQLNSAGLEAVKTERFDDAARSFEQGVRENPQDVEIVADLGFALTRAGQPRQALRPLYAAVLLDPRRTATWVPIAEQAVLSMR